MSYFRHSECDLPWGAGGVQGAAVYQIQLEADEGEGSVHWVYRLEGGAAGQVGGPSKMGGARGSRAVRQWSGPGGDRRLTQGG